MSLFRREIRSFFGMWWGWKGGVGYLIGINAVEVRLELDFRVFSCYCY